MEELYWRFIYNSLMVVYFETQKHLDFSRDLMLLLVFDANEKSLFSNRKYMSINSDLGIQFVVRV